MLVSLPEVRGMGQDNKRKATGGSMGYVRAERPLLLGSIVKTVQASKTQEHGPPRIRCHWPRCGNAESLDCHLDRHLHAQGDGGGCHRRVTGSEGITGALQVSFPAIGWPEPAAVNEAQENPRSVNIPGSRWRLGM